MQNIDDIFEIDLSAGVDSRELVNGVVSAFENTDRKNLVVKLKLGELQISQSQMVFVKSLVESYGNRLVFVETANESVREICREMNINTTNAAVKEISNIVLTPVEEVENAELSTLREEFKAEYGATMVQENAEPSEVAPTKHTISVYRKADEDKPDFEEEYIDFYAAPMEVGIVADSKETAYINQTLRSGQILEYDGNVVVIGDCHPGSEIRATGDITVWGILASVAHAGMKGDDKAKIRALKLNAVQLRIGKYYSRRPDCGNMPYVAKSPSYVPEEARVVDNEIVLFKVAQKG